jgi:hypothetical protein
MTTKLQTEIQSITNKFIPYGMLRLQVQEQLWKVLFYRFLIGSRNSRIWQDLRDQIK